MKDQIPPTNQNAFVGNRVSRPLWRWAVLIGAALTCLVMPPMVRAVDPPPDGGYANQNTAEGEDALFSLLPSTSGNTAIGFDALYSDTDGFYNTAIGLDALSSNTGGGHNTATGYAVLTRNTEGGANTASGSGALAFNTTGSANTATGYDALNFNTTGSNNTATGDNALWSNSTASNNTACGVKALYGSNGKNNIALGYLAGSNLISGSNDIYIAAYGAVGESNAIRLGKLGVQKNTYIVGISGTVVAGGVGVIVDSDGRLGTTTSSARYKEAIQPMDKASEALLALEPVTFHYKKDLDPKGIPQFGLVAEQVEKVDPDLVARDEEGKPYTVRYEAVNAMLLNEFLKEHRQVTDLKAAVADQEQEIKKLTATLAAQARQIEQVSAQVKADRPVPRLIADK